MFELIYHEKNWVCTHFYFPYKTLEYKRDFDLDLKPMAVIYRI